MSTVTGARAADEPEKLAIFRDAVITTVTVWKHGVSLGFNDSPLAINIEDDAEVRTAGQGEQLSADNRIALAKRMLDLLGRHVVSAAVAADGVFTMMLENNLELILRPLESGYESYVIFLPDDTTLVG
jgi:hypothetical protein